MAMKCMECGSDDMREPSRRILLPYRGVKPPILVEAIQCADCGRLFPSEEAVNEAHARLEANTMPAPPEPAAAR